MVDADGFALPFADQIRDLGIHRVCRLKYDKHICIIVQNAYERPILIIRPKRSIALGEL